MTTAEMVLKIWEREGKPETWSKTVTVAQVKALGLDVTDSGPGRMTARRADFEVQVSETHDLFVNFCGGRPWETTGTIRFDLLKRY